ncbi:enoyl-[acyl-carrier protein] reductase/trans-2-enoyl-CoA reductase (NAD+) [Streptosporangium album]|uniref:trans-2-enoyl-CoA reductase (NAD(+)) n=1 Tax=Streptosporangium album TaxID=47479 RepID=A0A7W7WDI2_9ACTN|nr:enoyl-[acyl-carrier-protein] reductase FabV [Streptosporangium album]MBB4942359.1 enoyl-[acyl-carrier protein] reductase/trans-2-enoyl-CoA reductase (NAD+) [Streptosporangium album]
MTVRLIQPTGRGFLLFDSHPDGCARLVTDMAERAQPATPANGGERPVALIIGSSSGYGLAATVAGISRYGVQGVGLCFERPPTERRTATAGWYRTIATAKLAEEAGSDFAFVNGDAFTDTTKDDVLDLIAKRFGGIDYLIYSVAAPRRTDPLTGVVHQSVIQPIGAEHVTKTLEFDSDGTPRLREIHAQPATAEETADTVKVMGGEDWSRWVDALDSRGLIRPGFTTVALSYIGSHLTSAIYRQGTIGAAKLHLESTASALGGRLSTYGGRALTSVNGAAVTQASTAIPGIALYVSLLRGVLGEDMRSPLDQSIDLWDQLLGAAPLDVDGQGRIRLDGWELAEDVQAAVTERWKVATADTIGDLADIDWFRDEVRRLYGFEVPNVDYSRLCDPDLPWPAA